jgi:hypothetical protein
MRDLAGVWTVGMCEGRIPRFPAAPPSAYNLRRTGTAYGGEMAVGAFYVSGSQCRLLTNDERLGGNRWVGIVVGGRVDFSEAGGD